MLLTLPRENPRCFNRGMELMEYGLGGRREREGGRERQTDRRFMLGSYIEGFANTVQYRIVFVRACANQTISIFTCVCLFRCKIRLGVFVHSSVCAVRILLEHQ